MIKFNIKGLLDKFPELNKRDYQIEGVCGGIGEFLGINSSYIRLIFVLLLLSPLSYNMVFIYIALSLIMQ